MPDKKEKPNRIKGVSVNRAEVKKAASLEEFKKVNPEIFSHLSDEDQDASYKELYAEGYSSATAAALANAGKPADNAANASKATPASVAASTTSK
jgi:aldehyde:ferredoxin oxidoreductase